MRAVVDGQEERIDTGAAVDVVVGIRVSSRCSVSRAVPGEVFASRFGLNIVCAVVDG